jgi:tRNA-binding protein
MDTISFQQFESVDIRVGTVVSVEDFPAGRYSTHILKVDFGPEFGVRTSLAKLKPNYQGPELVGKQICGAVNLGPKQIGKHISEFLTLGFADADGNVVLIHPGNDVPKGNKLY